MNKNIESTNTGFKIVVFNLIIGLSIIFLLLDRTELFPNINTALPMYVLIYFNIIFIVYYFLNKGIIHKSNIIFSIVFISYIFIIILYSLYSSDYEGIRYAIRLFVYLNLFLLLQLMNINRFLIICLGVFTSFLSVVLLLLWVPTQEFFKYSSFFINPNTLGIVIYLFFIVHLLTKNILGKRKFKLVFLFIIFIDLFLIFVSTSRAVWITLIVFLVIYFLWKKLSFNRWSHNIIFILAILSVLIYTYIYPQLFKTNVGIRLDEIVINFTGKSLFTGRQELWLYLIELIYEKPYFGYGIATQLDELMDVDLHAHNTFLSHLLQTGFIGLILYLILLYVLWNLLFIKVNKKNGEVSPYNKNILVIVPSFILSLIVYQTFELSFVMGGYATSVLEWILLSIGINLINQYNYINNKVL